MDMQITITTVSFGSLGNESLALLYIMITGLLKWRLTLLKLSVIVLAVKL